MVLAMSWLIFRGYQAGQETTVSDKEVSSPKVFMAPTEKTSLVKPTPEAMPGKEHIFTNALPSREDASPKNKSAESKGSWITPNQITYLDQSPQQKKILDLLKEVGELKFPPIEEPYYVGMNDQGFDQYEYNSRDGARVSQWKRSSDLAVEEVKFENGDRITRRAPENDRPFTEVSYENKAAGIYQSVYYRTNGTVESIRLEQNKTTTIYYYDEQGRLTDVYTYTEK